MNFGKTISGKTILFCFGLCFLLMHFDSAKAQQAKAEGTTFTNPLLPSGPDPWVVYKGGQYYYMHTMGNRLVLWKTTNLADLKEAERKTIWTPPENTSYSRQIWAPEIHFIKNKWYVYFAADDGQNENHRMYVIENASEDPMEGDWVFKGQITDPTDKWAIDGSVFEWNGIGYFIWSGWEGDENGQQNIYLAEMENPWTIKGDRVLLSEPDLPWEMHGDLPGQTPDHVNVNEGPEILKHGDDLFLIYSANGCWTDYYALGMLKLTDPDDILNPDSWYKYPEPVFQGAKENHVFSPGHNGFFKSPDGKEDWIIYHANSEAGQGCGSHRSPRMQPFGWNEDGTPDFGIPVKAGKRMPVPSGQNDL